MKPMLKNIGAFFILLYLIFTILSSIAFILSGIDEPQDFGSFIQSGLNVAHGDNPYSSDGDLVYKVFIRSLGWHITSPNLNPPISVAIFETVAKLGSPESLSKMWRLLSLGLYILIVFFLEKFYGNKKEGALFRVFWALSLGGFWHAIGVGQIYMPLLLFLGIAWVLLGQKKMIMAGILTGLILAIKPNFLVLILILFVTGGYLRFIIASIVTFVAVSMMPILFYGTQIYFQWLDAVRAYNGYALPNNSFVGLMVRFQHQEWGNLLSAMLIISLVVFLWRKKIDTHILFGIGIAASLLSSPIAWDSYTLFLLPYLYSQKTWLPGEKIGAAIFSIPFFVPYLFFSASFINYVIFGWTYGWGIITILISQIQKARSDHLVQHELPSLPTTP
jgi:hypothetical protein